MFKLIRNLILIGIVFFIGYLFGIKHIKFFKIVSSSMEPTLNIGDKIISLKPDKIKRKDIVVLLSPAGKKEILVKRVIGLPEERIKIENGYVYINGEKIEEEYIKEKPDYSVEETLIPSDCYFLLGDNRNESEDSKDWGPVQENLIIGKVIILYSPLKNFKFLK
ncbi:MAG: signal peptidase I [Candidatus Omnitrophica bacterium]|nr:signal peptidase I [Candidatus Omnitrophota bacterium]MCM8802188.1 signal peptidase I [Candidatus Omnitrophota bacterium]